MSTAHAPELPQPATEAIRANFTDMAERLAFSLHFHGVAHYLSADWYEKIDRWLTYIAIILAAVSTANAGSVINDYLKETPFNVTLVLLSSFCAVVLAFITGLNRTDHAPKTKKDNHVKAGSRHKELEQRVDIWGRTTAIDPSKTTDELITQYNEFVSDMMKIKEENITSEDWTFPHVHQQLGQKWKAIKEKDKQTEDNKKTQ